MNRRKTFPAAAGHHPRQSTGAVKYHLPGGKRGGGGGPPPAGAPVEEDGGGGGAHPCTRRRRAWRGCTRPSTTPRTRSRPAAGPTPARGGSARPPSRPPGPPASGPPSAFSKPGPPFLSGLPRGAAGFGRPGRGGGELWGNRNSLVPRPMAPQTFFHACGTRAKQSRDPSRSSGGRGERGENLKRERAVHVVVLESPARLGDVQDILSLRKAPARGPWG